MKFEDVNEESRTMVRNNNNNNNNNSNNNDNIVIIFKECLKNHALSNSGLVLDGCDEFLPIGPEGSPDALKCAVCNCHRDFHRKEAPLPPNAVAVATPILTAIIPTRDASPPYINHHQQAAPVPEYTMYHNLPGYLHVTAPLSDGGGPSALTLIAPPSGGGGGASALALVVALGGGSGGGPSTLTQTTPPSGGGHPFAIALIAVPSGGGGGEDHDDAMDFDNGGRGSSSNSKKRFRTKFTPEQKEKMQAFAEKVDWKVPKQDDNVVKEFCNENGVNRRVLKVWMHNNKHTRDSDLLKLDVKMCAMKNFVDEVH